MLLLYRVQDAYINYLRQFDLAVRDNKNGRRPYIGTALKIDGTEYFVPLSSPKPKHASMKNQVDFIKMYDSAYQSTLIAVINISNMIPVYSSVVSKIDIKAEANRGYRILLYRQARWIRNHSDKIQKNARRVHRMLTRDESVRPLSDFEQRLRARCCNLSLLEDKMQEYQKHYK